MDNKQEFDKAYEEELTKLRSENDHTIELYQGVDDPNKLTPDRKMVERDRGPILTEAQLQEQARDAADRRMRQSLEEQQQRAKVEESLREHNYEVQRRARHQEQDKTQAKDAESRWDQHKSKNQTISRDLNTKAKGR